MISDLEQMASAATEPPKPEAQLQISVTSSGRRSTVEARSGDAILHKDKGDLNSATFRDKVARAIAEKIGKSPDEIGRELLDHAGRDSQEQQPERAPCTRETLLAEKDAHSHEMLERMNAEVKAEALAILRGGKVMEEVMRATAGIGVEGELELRMTSYLIGTSRLLSKPLGGIIQGASSTGKSFVPDRVSRLFPEEAVLKAHDISPMALYYAAPGTLMNVWINAGERKHSKDPAQIDATKAMRELFSEGELTKLVTSGEGTKEAVQIHQYGPVAYAEGTTAAKIIDEDQNRMLSLVTDESRKQTKAVMRRQAAEAAGLVTVPPGLIERHNAMQRLLRRVEVDVPFAPQLAEAMPDERKEGRRAFGLLLSGIKAVALLHQYERMEQPEHGATIAATPQDYAVALSLLSTPLGRALGHGLAETTIHLHAELVEIYGATEFEIADALSKQTVVRSRQKVNDHLWALADAGLAKRASEGRGRVGATWVVIGQAAAIPATWLPAPEELQ